MSSLRAVPLVTALVLAWLVVIAPPASAHALLERSYPAAGAELSRSPGVMLLYFTEPPDPRLSTVSLLNSAGRTVPGVGKPAVAPGKAPELRIALPRLAMGVYTVNWRTVSNTDGHVTNGSFAFGIGVQPPIGAAGGGSAGSAPGPAAVVGLWLLYWGLALLAAAGVMGIVVFRWRLPGKAGLVIAAGWLYAAVGLLIMILSEQAAASVPFGELFATAAGRSLLAQAIALAACGVVALYVARRAAGRRLALLAAAAAAALFVHAQAGHAEVRSPVRLLNVADQWLHMLAAAVWIGGLVWLLLGLRELHGAERASAVGRFSQLALAAVSLIAVTGVLRAIPEVGSLGALTSTGFGITLLVKTGLFAVLMAFAWRNKYRLVPRIVRSRDADPGGQPHATDGSAERSGARITTSSGRLAWVESLPSEVAGPLAIFWLRRSVRSEVALAAIVVVAAAVLSGLAPASDVLASRQSPSAAAITVTGSDFGTTARVRLTVSPGTVGPNRFTIHVNRYNTGSPLPARSVQLEFSLASNPNVTSGLSLARGADGIWTGAGTNLSIVGQWTIDVVVQEAATATDVPLRLRARSAP